MTDEEKKVAEGKEAETKRLAAEKAAAEKAEANRLEAEKVAAEKAELDRLEAEKAAAQNANAPSASEKKLRDKGLEILKNYPKNKEAYVTSDGFVFFSISDAGNHAATIKDKTVITVNKK